MLRVALLPLALASAVVSAGCSAFIVPEELDASTSDAGDEASSNANDTEADEGDTGPVPHPLDNSPEIDCADAEVFDTCTWKVENTGQECELNCELASVCAVLEVDYDHDTEAYVDPVDGTTLGCLLDALGAGSPAYFEWRERGVGNEVTSDTIYRAWLLRPEELILARWHESTVNGNIGEFGQELTAVSFDQTQLLDCQDETEGSARYACLLQAMDDAGCFGFGPASCE